MNDLHTKVRVVLADDHALTRAGFRLLLEQVAGVEVVGEADHGEELVRLAESLAPDIVFTDIEMPGGDGLDAIRVIANSRPEVRCVVVSMHKSADMVRRAASSGAAGYVLKDAPAHEFRDAINNILARGSYYSPAVAALLMAKPDPLPHELLTERQIEILKRVANGLSTKEIAYELELSTKTVDAHRARIMEKIGVRDVVSMSRYALRHGIVSL